MNSCISHSPNTLVLETSLSPQHLLAIGERKRSGLILCKEHYAEFAGPGAAINNSLEQSYSVILAIGSPDIVNVKTHEERQKAYSRRIQWVRWLNKIVSYTDPLQRAEKLLTGFEEFFGSEILTRIPIEVLGLLAGVLPQTIALVQSQATSSGNATLVSLSNFSEDNNVSILRLGSQPLGLVPVKSVPHRPACVESLPSAFSCSA